MVSLVKEIELIPPASSLIESLRAFGYTFETAVADLIDNSIAASATRIEVHVEDDDELRVAVIDNGSGMDIEELLRAMTPGGRSPGEIRDSADLGRFSLGLKTASFSQCRKLTVVTRKNSVTSAVTWDLDLVARRGQWIALAISDVDRLPFVDRIGRHGTAVIWENVDRIAGSELQAGTRARAHTFNEQVSAVADHLQVVFHRFMEGDRRMKKVTLEVNGRTLVPFDPFNRNHPATVFLPSEVIHYGGAEILVQPVILPHFSKVDKPTWDRHAGPRGYLRGQGFYIYRNRRLIVDGSWLRLMKQTPLTQLARVQIDIDNALDHEWRIGVRKDSAELPQHVRMRLKEILDRIDLQARRPFTRRGAVKASTQRLPMWDRVQDADTISYRINPSNPVVAVLEEALPEDLRPNLRRLLTLIASSLPLETIFSDIGTDGEKVSSGSITDDVLEEATRLLFGRLADAGLATDDAAEALLAAEPFRSNRKRTLRLLNVLIGEGA